MHLLGYICATLVGISLGVLGSGGSILTVPIMVYLLNIQPVEAIAYSLFVVGLTSTIGGFTYVWKKLVDLKTAAIFAIPSILSVYLTRKLIIPLVPDPVYAGESFMLTRDIFIMSLFSLLMIVVAYNMIRPTKFSDEESTKGKFDFAKLIIVGLISGVLTGFLGVGGGFIIIPALVLFAKVPIRMSVGTSLLIIAFNSFTGFAEEVINNNSDVNYDFLLKFSLLSAFGIFIGFRLSLSLNSSQLKKIFGWFILVMGVCLFVNELFFR